MGLETLSVWDGSRGNLAATSVSAPTFQPMNQGPTLPTSGKHKKSGGVENLIDSVCLSPCPLYNQSLGISAQQEISNSLKATMEDLGVSTHVLSWAFRTFTLSLLCVGVVSGAVRKAIHTTDL